MKPGKSAASYGTTPCCEARQYSASYAPWQPNKYKSLARQLSTSGSAESNRPCMATHVSQLQEPLSATLKFSLEEPHGSGDYMRSLGYSAT